MNHLCRSVFVSTLLGLFSVLPVIAQAPADEQVAAIQKNDQKKLSALLQQGANPNSRDLVKQPILSLAAYLGREKMVSMLLANGADLRAADGDGWNALHNAALAGHLAIARLLLDRGLDVNARQTDGLTPLAHAAVRGHLKVMQL